MRHEGAPRVTGGGGTGDELGGEWGAARAGKLGKQGRWRKNEGYDRDLNGAIRDCGVHNAAKTHF